MNAPLRPQRSLMAQFAQDRHKRACKALGYALICDSPTVWSQMGLVLAHRLTSQELTSIAFVILQALEPENREAAFTAAQWGIA